MKQVYLIVFLFLFGLLSCKKDDQIAPENVLKQQIVDKLSTMKDVTIFLQAFENLDASYLDASEFTMFAIENEAFDVPKKSSSLAQDVLKRHIVKGSYNLSKLKNLNYIVSIGQDTLIVETINDSIRINGVPLNVSQEVGRSIIYLVNNIISESYTPKFIVSFEVKECNGAWSIENPEQAFPSANATVNIFKANKELYTTLTTDENGFANFVGNRNEEFYYQVVKENLSEYYQNLKVLGLITSQEEIDELPYYRHPLKKLLGGLKLEDVNKDGIVDDMDKFDSDLTQFNSSAVKFNVYIAPASFEAPKFTITQTDFIKCRDLHDQAFLNFTRIDNSYSSQESRTRITPQDTSLTLFWYNSYKLIEEADKLLKIKISGDDVADQYEYQNLIRLYRASTLFNLSLAFGEIPFDNTSSKKSETIIYENIVSELTYAIQYLTEQAKFHAISLSGRTNILLDDYNQAYNLFRTIDQQWDIDKEFILQNILFRAETEVRLNKISEAVQSINLFFTTQGLSPNYPQGLVPSQAELQAKIEELFILHQTGFRYFNTKRWGKNLVWTEKYKLLPIPEDALNTNPNLTQNIGW